MMKKDRAHGEMRSWISPQKVTTLTDFSSLRIASLDINRCDYFVIDSNEGMRLCRSWFQRSEKRWSSIAILIQREFCSTKLSGIEAHSLQVHRANGNER
jgi:hypothetical protein